MVVSFLPEDKWATLWCVGYRRETYDHSPAKCLECAVGHRSHSHGAQDSDCSILPSGYRPHVMRRQCQTTRQKGVPMRRFRSVLIVVVLADLLLCSP